MLRLLLSQMSTSLPNDVYSNLIQFPIVFVCCILVPILKTYCCKESRHKLVWRYDVLRHMICNVSTFVLEKGFRISLSKGMKVKGRKIYNDLMTVLQNIENDKNATTVRQLP